mmetsp:Transcript_64876/g.148604  ORF Transcript_64876/g.148604 Transcript_64876/m.148604 type:complete len:576 (-) Transcript_64876:34-1761(-)
MSTRAPSFGMRDMCTCALCPNVAVPFVLAKTAFSKLEKGLFVSRIEVDKDGTLYLGGEYFDLAEGGRPETAAQPLAGIKAVMQMVAQGEIRGPSPFEIQDAGMRVLTQFYDSHPRNKKLLLNICVPLLADPRVTITFLQLCVKGVGYGSSSGSVHCLSFVRKLIRDETSKKRLLCLMWRRDVAKKQYLCVLGLIQLMSSKHQKVQEDAARVTCMLVRSDEQAARLARIRSVIKGANSCLEKGSGRSMDTACWLLFRLSCDREFCERLAGSQSVMKTVVDKALLEDPVKDNSREENALAVLANCASYAKGDENMLEKYPQLTEVAVRALRYGSERAVENGAALIANVAFDVKVCGTLQTDKLGIERLCALALHGSDRAKELSVVALGNLSLVPKHAKAMLKVAGLTEILLAISDTAARVYSRRAASVILTNLSIQRLNGNGARLPAGRCQVEGETRFRSKSAMETKHCLSTTGVHFVPADDTWLRLQDSLRTELPLIKPDATYRPPQKPDLRRRNSTLSRGASTLGIPSPTRSTMAGVAKKGLTVPLRMQSFEEGMVGVSASVEVFSFVAAPSAPF